MKTLILIIIALLTFSQITEAALIDKNAMIAVMDLGNHKSNAESDFDLMNAEKAASEYIIQCLIKHKVNIIDKDLIQDELKKKNLNTSSLIDPDTAKQIAEILNIDYIVYGNVISVTLEGKDKVTARIVTRIKEVKTGKIIMAAKGVGTAENSFFTVNNAAANQGNIHNALKKAALQSVDILIDRLYGKK